MQPPVASVEVLLTEDCPNASITLERVREAARIMGIKNLRPKIVRIVNAGEASAVRFLGSPSVRVNGRDVEPEANTRRDFGLQCRVYRVGAAFDRAPECQ